MRYSDVLAKDTTALYLFHGVIPSMKHSVRNYIRKHIPQDYFQEVLRDLKSRGNALSLDQWLEFSEGRLPKNDLPPNSYVITFDDGFENNYSLAAPILSELRIPAIFYVTTNFVGVNGRSWVDVLESAFEAVPSFHLEIPEIGIRGDFKTVEEKISGMRQIRMVLKNDPTFNPYDLTKKIISKLGLTDGPFDKDLDAKLSWEQIRELDRTDGFTIGGHGHTHRILEFLSDDLLKEEIEKSLRIIADGVGHPVTHYCYPDGLENCYSERVITLLKQNGIRCSPSAIPGTNRLGDNPFHLRRIMVV